MWQRPQKWQARMPWLKLLPRWHFAKISSFWGYSSVHHPLVGTGRQTTAFFNDRQKRARSRFWGGRTSSSSLGKNGSIGRKKLPLYAEGSVHSAQKMAECATKMSPEPTTRTCRPSRWTAVISEAIELPRHHIRDDLQPSASSPNKRSIRPDPQAAMTGSRGQPPRSRSAMPSTIAALAGQVAPTTTKILRRRGSGIRSRTHTIRVVGRLQIGVDHGIGYETRPR